LHSSSDQPLQASQGGGVPNFANICQVLNQLIGAKIVRLVYGSTHKIVIVTLPEWNRLRRFERNTLTCSRFAKLGRKLKIGKDLHARLDYIKIPIRLSCPRSNVGINLSLDWLWQLANGVPSVRNPRVATA
jgi:hypothetical protein